MCNKIFNNMHINYNELETCCWSNDRSLLLVRFFKLFGQVVLDQWNECCARFIILEYCFVWDIWIPLGQNDLSFCLGFSKCRIPLNYKYFYRYCVYWSNLWNLLNFLSIRFFHSNNFERKWMEWSFSNKILLYLNGISH